MKIHFSTLKSTLSFYSNFVPISMQFLRVFHLCREVLKSLGKTVNLYRRWSDLQAEPITVNLLKDEIEWTTTELRNSLRSTEWDLEDLEDTLNILFDLDVRR